MFFTKGLLVQKLVFLCWETLIMRSTTSQILNMLNIEHCFQFSFNVALSRAPSSLLFFSFDTKWDNLVRLNDTKRDLIAIIFGLLTTVVLTEIVLELKTVPSDLSFNTLLRLQYCCKIKKVKLKLGLIFRLLATVSS